MYTGVYTILASNIVCIGGIHYVCEGKYEVVYTFFNNRVLEWGGLLCCYPQRLLN